MIPVAKLKQNLDFNKSFGGLIEIMKLAATLQFSQFRSQNEPFSDFRVFLEKALSNCFSNRSYLQNKFIDSLETAQDRPSLIVLISSNEGFLGELNSALVSKFYDNMKKQDKIIVVGQQGENYLQESKIDFESFPYLGDKVEFEQINALRDNIFGRYAKGDIYKVHVVYAHFVNISFQQIESEILLPLSDVFFTQAKNIKWGEFLIEPDVDSVIESFVKLWLFFRLYQIFWTSKLAELSARIMHLDGSIQELTRINQRLKLEYFKYVHALSDKTIREISSSRLIKRMG